ncbi:hypothetical protein K7432_016860, partial [Basidiobolus ranarum]
DNKQLSHKAIHNSTFVKFFQTAHSFPILSENLGAVRNGLEKQRSWWTLLKIFFTL